MSGFKVSKSLQQTVLKCLWVSEGIEMWSCTDLMSYDFAFEWSPLLGKTRLTTIVAKGQQPKTKFLGASHQMTFNMQVCHREAEMWCGCRFSTYKHIPLCQSVALRGSKINCWVRSTNESEIVYLSSPKGAVFNHRFCKKQSKSGCGFSPFAFCADTQQLGPNHELLPAAFIPRKW